MLCGVCDISQPDARAHQFGVVLKQQRNQAARQVPGVACKDPVHRYAVELGRAHHDQRVRQVAASFPVRPALGLGPARPCHVLLRNAKRFPGSAQPRAGTLNRFAWPFGYRHGPHGGQVDDLGHDRLPLD